MSEIAAKAVDKFKLVSEAMLELEKSDNWYSKELAFLDQRRHNFGIKDYEYYQLMYQLKGIVLQTILDSLK